jgi:hypothetical protein
VSIICITKRRCDRAGRWIRSTCCNSFGAADDRRLRRSANVLTMNSWRYLPASINGKPIEAWTTVIVRFAAI